MIPEEKYMQRALQLAAYGAGFVSPNPMVGAVIVAPDGRIIGEGWHRRFGGPHAEVNAVASVRPEDERLLTESTIYVTLEPCSHYGKTPPCSLLLIQKRLKRVIIGSADPFPLVAGRGVRMLRKAGIEVIEDFMREQCDALNRRFLFAHTHQRPYVQLKWAQSADGYIAAINDKGKPVPVKLSDPVTLCLMHAQRAMADAIMVGSNTIIIDNPSLSTRLWPGHSPRPVTFRTSRLPETMALDKENLILIDPEDSLEKELHRLYEEFKITSLMVEGGARTLCYILDSGLANEIRVETSPVTIGHGIPAPSIPAGFALEQRTAVPPLANPTTDARMIASYFNKFCG